VYLSWDWGAFLVGAVAGAVLVTVLLALLDRAARTETEDRWR
jgi:hypothetical protein